MHGFYDLGDDQKTLCYSHSSSPNWSSLPSHPILPARAFWLPGTSSEVWQFSHCSRGCWQHIWRDCIHGPVNTSALPLICTCHGEELSLRPYENAAAVTPSHSTHLPSGPLRSTYNMLPRRLSRETKVASESVNLSWWVSSHRSPNFQVWHRSPNSQVRQLSECSQNCSERAKGTLPHCVTL